MAFHLERFHNHFTTPANTVRCRICYRGGLCGTSAFDPSHFSLSIPTRSGLNPTRSRFQTDVEPRIRSDRKDGSLILTVHAEEVATSSDERERSWVPSSTDAAEMRSLAPSTVWLRYLDCCSDARRRKMHAPAFELSSCTARGSSRRAGYGHKCTREKSLVRTSRVRGVAGDDLSTGVSMVGESRPWTAGKRCTAMLLQLARWWKDTSRRREAGAKLFLGAAAVPGGFAELGRNLVFMAGFYAWAIAQVMKVFTTFYKEGKWTLKPLMESGGMPSSHSSLVMGVTTAVALKHGLGSTLFPICLAFSLIVMYDAAGVRRHAGKQAEVLNMIVAELFHGHPVSETQLKELIGHTPSQVLAGALLGVLIPMFCMPSLSLIGR